MAYYSKTIFFILFAVFSFLFPKEANAQYSNIPEIGDTIFFFPVSNAYKNSVGGYDCFFDMDKALKKGRIKANPSNRYKRDKNGLTPLKEIQEHIFIVKKILIEYESTNKGARATCIYLQREDKDNIILRVPYQNGKKDNILTRNMVIRIGTETYVSIPCADAIKYYHLKGELINHRIACFNTKDSSLLILNAQRINENFPVEMLSLRNASMTVSNISLCDLDGFIFSQPIVTCKQRNRTLYLPVFDFRGSGAKYYGYNYCITDFYDKYEKVWPIFCKQYCTDRIISFHSQKLIYTGNNEKGITASYQNQMKNYPLRVGASYLFKGIGLSNGYKVPYETICAVFEDKEGIRFEIPIEDMPLSSSVNLYKDNFLLPNDYNRLKEDIAKKEKAQQERKRQEELKKQKEKDKKIFGTFYCSKSGDKYIFKSDYTGTFEVQNTSFPSTFRWSRSYNRITITYTGDFAFSGVQNLTYNTDSNTIVEHSETWGWLIFEKIK